MTKDQWTAAVRRVRDGLVAKVRGMMPPEEG